MSVVKMEHLIVAFRDLILVRWVSNAHLLWLQTADDEVLRYKIYFWAMAGPPKCLPPSLDWPVDYHFVYTSSIAVILYPRQYPYRGSSFRYRTTLVRIMWILFVPCSADWLLCSQLHGKATTFNPNLKGPWSPKLTYTFYPFSWKCRILW